MSVSVSFVPNVVVQHVNCFVVCCVWTTHYKRKVPSYLSLMWHTILVSVYAIRARYTLRDSHLVTLSLKSMYFQIFGKNYCSKIIEATTVKNVPNERKLIYAIYNFIVASWYPFFVW